MTDPRNRKLAELLVDTCLGVQSGWEVVVAGSPPGRPLLEELVKLIAERDAYAFLRLSFDDSTRSDLAGGLRDVALGIGALLPSLTELSGVRDRLLSALPGIGLDGA